MASGLATLLAVVLAYIAMWRPRVSEVTKESALAAERQPSVGYWLVTYMPWLLIVAFVGFAIWVVVYILYMAARPPNW